MLASQCYKQSIRATVVPPRPLSPYPPTSLMSRAGEGPPLPWACLQGGDHKYRRRLFPATEGVVAKTNVLGLHASLHTLSFTTSIAGSPKLLLLLHSCPIPEVSHPRFPLTSGSCVSRAWDQLPHSPALPFAARDPLAQLCCFSSKRPRVHSEHVTVNHTQHKSSLPLPCPTPCFLRHVNTSARLARSTNSSSLSQITGKSTWAKFLVTGPHGCAQRPARLSGCIFLIVLFPEKDFSLGAANCTKCFAPGGVCWFAMISVRKAFRFCKLPFEMSFLRADTMKEERIAQIILRHPQMLGTPGCAASNGPHAAYHKARVPETALLQ